MALLSALSPVLQTHTFGCKPFFLIDRNIQSIVSFVDCWCMSEHEYFDVTAIYEDIERNDNYDMGDILTRYEDYGFSHRWIQPPVACYWIVSQDSHGNTNMAPISMGTAMWGEPSDGIWYYCFDVQNRRQTRRNIMQTRECVISYYPKDLLKESWISAGG